MRIVDLTIDSVAFGGKGIGRDNGKTIFVPFTIHGEIVSAKIVREKKQFAEAELVELKKRSPERVEARCPYFGRCGGCSYQHIHYRHQLTLKEEQVRDVLKRIGKLKNVPVRPIIPSPAEYSYRNRITVHAQNGVVGYFRRDSHQLLDVKECPIARDEVNQELTRLRASKPRDGHYTLRTQIRGANSVSSEQAPRIFSQTNDGVARALRELVVHLVPDKQDLLIDAYCGAGFFAKALLNKFERVVGVDWDRFAIEQARMNITAKENYIAVDVEEQLMQLARSGSASIADTVKWRPGEGRSLTLIADPPAIGLSATVRQTIIHLAPNTFVYVSCNPATLARDLAELKTRFNIESITPLDMFPQTAEIEAVAHLRRSDDSTI